MALGIRSIHPILRSSNLNTLRKFYTSSFKMEKALENLQSNPYYEKYAERIASLQKTSPEEFLQRVEQQTNRKQNTQSKPLDPPDIKQYSSVLNPKDPINKEAQKQEKSLDAIFKTELVKDKQAPEIQTIWEEYHRNKDVIAATIPVSVYEEILQCTRQHPTFIFPLPREQGYEFIVCQSIGHELHFTPLLAFQVHKENAPECLTIVHYPELKEKGIILMRGEFDKNVLSAQEAQCLANQFKLYYSDKDEAKTKLLQEFTKKPDTFKHMELIAQLENITLK